MRMHLLSNSQKSLMANYSSFFLRPFSIKKKHLPMSSAPGCDVVASSCGNSCSLSIQNSTNSYRKCSWASKEEITWINQWFTLEKSKVYITRMNTEFWTKHWRLFRRAKMVPKISMASELHRSLYKRNRPTINVPVLPTPALKWKD